MRARGHADGSRSEDDDIHSNHHHHHHHHHSQLAAAKSNSPQSGPRNGIINFGAHPHSSVAHTRSADSFHRHNCSPLTTSTMAVAGGANGGPRPHPLLNGDYDNDDDDVDNLPDSDFDEFDDSGEEEEDDITNASSSTTKNLLLGKQAASQSAASFSSASSSSSAASSASHRTRTSEKAGGTPTLPKSSYEPHDTDSSTARNRARRSSERDRSSYLEVEEEEEEEISEHTANSQDNEIHEIYYQEKQVAVIGRCRAMYDYTANMYDELTIQFGDIINIHDKQEDGWWLGECQGKVGIFPATYVELI